jgi:hypothetical protein
VSRVDLLAEASVALSQKIVWLSGHIGAACSARTHACRVDTRVAAQRSHILNAALALQRAFFIR